MPKLALRKLTDADITLDVPGPSLTETAADTLQNEMTGADGFDLVMQGITAAIGSDYPWVQSWDTLTAAMDFPPGQIDSTLIGPLLSDFALFAASGDVQAADLVGALGGASPSPPTPAPPPTSTPPVTTAPVHGPAPPQPVRAPAPPTTIIYIDEPSPGTGGGGGGGGEQWGGIKPPSEE